MNAFIGYACTNDLITVGSFQLDLILLVIDLSGRRRKSTKFCHVLSLLRVSGRVPLEG